jgi:hypothetical protein
MKGNQLYIAVIVVFIILVFLFELAAPQKFNWKPTYDKYDREPFGSYVFDDVLSSSIDDYRVVNKTFFQIWEEDSAAAPKAFLLTENRFDFSGTDINHLFKLLYNGNQIMICTDYLPRSLQDTLNIVDIENLEHTYSLERYLENNQKQRDSIFLVTDTLGNKKIYEVYPFVHPSTIRIGKWEKSYNKDTTYYNKDTVYSDNYPKNALKHDSIKIDSSYSTQWRPMKSDSVDTLANNKHGRTLAVKIPVGKGELFIVSTPLMFTNFGILDDQNAAYIFGLLSHMKGKPFVRIEAYGNHDEKPAIPLRYLLITPPLRWAVYTAILLILLFMIFTAKRRQRIIPVVETPPNRTLGFIQLISSLFYSRHDNAEILKTKYSVFCSVIKQKTGVDLLDNKHDDSHFSRLAEKIGMPEDEIKQLIKEFRMIPYQYDVPDDQLKELADKMNGIRNQEK